VVGRVSTFADAEVIRMAQEEFVAVAADDWYQRRKQDDEGEFFRKVSDQGPRKNNDGSTRQGVYVFTAAGKLLGYRNHEDAGVMRDVLKKALADWKKLPAAQRKPGAVVVGEPAKIDANYTRTPPKGGLIVNVYTRILDKDAKGDFCHGTCAFTGGNQSAHDHLWLTAEDIAALVSASAKKGDVVPLPPQFINRLLRYHMVDNTRGEASFWQLKEVRKQSFKLSVVEVAGQTITLRLEGTALLATDADVKKAERGFDVSVLGTLRYHREKKAFDRFDMVALGDHWGAGTFTQGARPGRMPLGIAFELAQPGNGADLVPPQGARDWREYLQADKH
jgi:hypothetical protein